MGFSRLSFFRNVSDEGVTDGVYYFGVPSTAESFINRIFWSDIIYEQLHSIHKNLFYFRFQGLWRIELGLEQMGKQFF